MKINKNELRQRILDYNSGSISDIDKEKLWDDLTEICAYQIKKSKDDRRYYDIIQDMVIYVLEHYLGNFTVYNEEGKENSSLAFCLQSAYYTKLVLYNSKYKFENNEFPTMNISSQDCEGNSTEIVNTWSNEAYSSIWERAWGKTLPVNRDADKKEDKEEKDRGTDIDPEDSRGWMEKRGYRDPDGEED